MTRHGTDTGGGSNEDATAPETRGGFGRRGAALVGLGILGACAVGGPEPGPKPARAQGGGTRNSLADTSINPTVSAYVAPPCAQRPGDVVGVLFEGPAPEGVAVFGQAFRPGDLPPGAALTGRIGGRAIAAQCDVLARHPDGSARHAAVSLALPALRADERAAVLLARADAAAGPALALGDALAGREAVVEIRPLQGGGEPWRADLLALWRTAPAQPWQSGPLALQGRVERPVPPAAAGGVASLRLVADISARADGTLWVDLWLRNDVAMRPNGGEASYALRLVLDGREALAVEAPRHPQYMGWGRLRGARRGGDPVRNAAHLRPDTVYLGAAGGLLPYDVSVGVDEGELARMATLAADARWDELFFPRGLQVSMGAPGGRPDLGITTQWQAAWLLSGDRRAARVALGQAETAANVPWNFWDPGGGRDGAGGWLDVRRWPGFWSDIRGGRPPQTLLQPVAGRDQTFGWGTIASHAPPLSYVPYLLTARRGFLDNHMAQAAWTITSLWPAVRHMRTAHRWPSAGPVSAEPAEDVLLLWAQLRQAAWSLRTVGEAGWIAPDNHPNREYFRDVERRNWQWTRRFLPEWTELQGEAHGYVPFPALGYSDGMTQFQQEYFGAVAAQAALRGEANAREVFSWQRNFLVGRFFQEANGFPRRDAIAYSIGIGPTPPNRFPGPPHRPLQTWREIGDQTRALGLQNDERWRASNGEYGRLAMLSLALVHHVFADARALEAWEWLAQSGATHTHLGSFARMPQHNISPRGRWKVAARAPRCAAA